VTQKPPKRILIVDDEPSICRIVVELLQGDGHDAHAATTPEEALELCRTLSFDLIFVDHCLSEMSAEELLAILRRAKPRQKIVLISGQKPPPAVGQADCLVKKPFTADTIRDAVALYAC
jgi:CheY-like chemotaxis protein